MTKSITADVAARLGYAVPAALNPATTQHVLPVLWDKEPPLSNLFDMMAEIEAHVWAVWDRDASGNFQFAFQPWNAAPSKAWTATKAMIAGRPDPSNDVYNAARVFYTDLTGALKSVTALADGLGGHPQDPFMNTRRAFNLYPRVYTTTLDNDQPDAALATAVANSILQEYSVPQFDGTITLYSALDAGIEKPACLIRAGDTITITDYGPGSQTFRVYGTSNTDSGPTELTIGRRHPNTDQILADAELLVTQHQQWKST